MKLINRLDELDITRKSLADEVGVTERSVYRWLSYQKEPKLTFNQVAKMCSLLGWTAQQLAESYYPPDSSPPLSVEPGGGDSPK